METRDRILREMLHHVEQFGYKRTRLVAIAEDLGMSHANIYKHFKNKGEILDSIVLSWLAEADEIIAREVRASETPKEAVLKIVVGLNQFLSNKLSNEPAALDVFRHAFTNQSVAVANHLTNLKLQIGKSVMAHETSAKTPNPGASLTLDLLTTTLESFLNPLIIYERQSDNDADQLVLLVDRLMLSG